MPPNPRYLLNLKAGRSEGRPLRQAAQFVHQGIYLAVGGGDGALWGRTAVRPYGPDEPSTIFISSAVEPAGNRLTAAHT